MGLQLSCFDTNRLNTFPDSSMARTITDGELTEFLANSSFLLEEKIPNKKDTFSKPLTKLEIYQVSSIETDYTPKPSDSIQNSPLLHFTLLSIFQCAGQDSGNSSSKLIRILIIFIHHANLTWQGLNQHL